MNDGNALAKTVVSSSLVIVVDNITTVDVRDKFTRQCSVWVLAEKNDARSLALFF